MALPPMDMDVDMEASTAGGEGDVLALGRDEASVNLQPVQAEADEVTIQQPQQQQHKKSESRKIDYRPILCRLINYLDEPDTEYKKDDVDNGNITAERLGRITPTDISKWLNFTTFGVEDPGHQYGNMKPQIRSSTLDYLKKAISFYMPNRFPWNVILKSGNPTQSRAINDLIKYVKKKEARKEGVVSQARRSITVKEIAHLYKMLKSRTHSNAPLRNYHYGIPAMTNYQLQMIARVDDCCMATLENLQSVEQHPFVLKTRLTWSKNVQTEDDAPWQFLLACMDAAFDPHSSLGLWLETYYHEYPPGIDTPYIFQFSDDLRIPEGGLKNKKKTQEITREYYQSEEFQDVTRRNGPVGTHSIRKRGSTMARLNGASRDEKDYRGRWKKHKRVSDAYDDVELPFIDAKVAACLCPGGACRYDIRPNSGVTDAFILEFVTPKVRQMLDDGVALIIGRALLWYVFADEEGVYPVPDFLRERIRNNINLPEGMLNPIKKIQITVSGNDAEVGFNDVEDFEMEVAAAPVNNATTTAPDNNTTDNNTTAPPPIINAPTRAFVGTIANLSARDQLQVLHNQQRQLYNQNIQIMRMLKDQDKQRNTEYLRLNRNIQRIALQPARRIGCCNPNPTIQEQLNVQPANILNNNTSQTPQQPNPPQQAPIYRGPASNLSKVNNLYELWNEYEFGNEGNKAAKYFTAHERGMVKHKYTRRKVIWECILRQINRGVSYNVAIDRIYSVYGQDSSVTSIINAMRRDKRTNNLHVSLR